MSTVPPRYDFGVVGGGIVGLATARALLAAHPGARVAVWERESAVGTHQTGHNSGVVHAGLYYQPGSLKARLCAAGRVELKRYATERGLAYEECGKLVVATAESELPRLRELHARGLANGVPGLRLLDDVELRAVEPHARGLAAIHSPSTAITDFGAVAGALAADLVAAGAQVLTGRQVVGVEQTDREVRVRLADGTACAVWRLVVCGGLWADRLAELAGDTPGPRIVPFRGDYYRLRGGSSELVRGLIYPVPDPRYPFLGVHLTRTVRGEVLVGPNALLALARDGYRMRDVRAADLADTLRWPGFRRLAARHWRTGAAELHRSLSRRAFARAARRYVPAVRAGDLTRAPSGVRAQALDASGELVDDFRLSTVGLVTAVRNAPSPAATSSLAIGAEIARAVSG